MINYDIKKYFTKCSDDNYLFFNYFVSCLLFREDYFYKIIKDDQLIKVVHFIITNNNNNVYDYLNIDNYIFSLEQRKKTKLLVGCLLCYDFKIPESFQKIINVIFGDELNDMNKIKENYKLKEVVKPKKINKKKVIEI